LNLAPDQIKQLGIPFLFPTGRKRHERSGNTGGGGGGGLMETLAKRMARILFQKTN